MRQANARSTSFAVNFVSSGAPVPIGGRAFDFMEILVRSAGELVTKDELMDQLWPGAVVTENALQVLAGATRKALGYTAIY